MKKFREIEAKYLKIGRNGVDLLVFLLLVSTVILGVKLRERTRQTK
jgi:hypothetical protein